MNPVIQICTQSFKILNLDKRNYVRWIVSEYLEKVLWSYELINDYSLIIDVIPYYIYGLIITHGNWRKTTWWKTVHFKQSLNHENEVKDNRIVSDGNTLVYNMKIVQPSEI